AGRGQRRARAAGDDVLKREAQLVRLVQRHLQDARHYLRRAREAGGGREDQREAVGAQRAIAQHLVHHHRRRRAVDLEHQAAGVRAVAIAELAEQLFLRRQRTRWPGAEREELLSARVLLARRE